MTKMTCWLCDAAGILGACLLLYGVYLAWSLAISLMVLGLILMAGAARVAWMCQHDS